MNTTDRIEYTRAFAENVKGHVYARFRLDPSGVPEFEEEADGLRHYTIDIYLHSPRVSEIEEVTYILDDTTYIDPVRKSKDRANDFHEEVWSYGEVPIIVRVKLGGQVYEQRVWLSHLLMNGHTANMTPPIRSAIQTLKVN